MNQPVFPDYTNSIMNLSCSFLNHFGAPVKHNTLPYVDKILSKGYKHVVAILLDGFGVNILEKHLEPEAFLRKHLLTEYSSVFPPTTVASTTSMLSGLSPVEHGWLGWDVYFEQEDTTVTCFFNTIADTQTPAASYNIPHKYFHYKKIDEQINEANPDGSVEAEIVFPFGPRPFPEIDDWFAEIKRHASCDKRTFTYAYWENPDHNLHRYGTESEEVHKVIADLNARIEKLCSELSDTVVFITADHGHTDVNNECYETDFPEFAKMFARTPSIEPRGTSFFVKEEYLKPADNTEVNSADPEKNTIFAREFQRLFGNDYVLFSRKEVFEKQIFGTGEPNKNLTGIGDYVAAAIGSRTIYPTKYMYDKGFKSHHAGMTESDMKIPLICCERK